MIQTRLSTVKGSFPRILILRYRNAYIDDQGQGRTIPTDNDTLIRLPWDGVFSDGAEAPDGSYRLKASVLKMLAKNFDDPNNWETFISPKFTIKREKEQE